MKRLTFIFVLSAILLCLASCKRMELHVPTSSIYVKFNIERNLGVEDYRQKYQVIKLSFYDIENHVICHEDFISVNGGFMNVKPGVYDVIFQTFGSDVTMIGNPHERATSYAYTSSSGRAGTINSPNHLFVGRAQNLAVQIYSKSEGARIMEVDMTTIVETYTIEFKKVSGCDNISSAKLYVPGQVPYRYLWDGRKPNSECSVAVPLQIDVENNKMFAEFNTFGRVNGANILVKTELEIKTKDGYSYNFTCDITDQFDNPDNTEHKIIIDNTVIIPEAGDTGTSFNPEIKDWDDEITHIPLQ